MNWVVITARACSLRFCGIGRLIWTPFCSSYIAERVARSPTCRSARHGIDGRADSTWQINHAAATSPAYRSPRLPVVPPCDDRTEPGPGDRGHDPRVDLGCAVVGRRHDPEFREQAASSGLVVLEEDL